MSVMDKVWEKNKYRNEHLTDGGPFRFYRCFKSSVWFMYHERQREDSRVEVDAQ